MRCLYISTDGVATRCLRVLNFVATEVDNIEWIEMHHRRAGG